MCAFVIQTALAKNALRLGFTYSCPWQHMKEHLGELGGKGRSNLKDHLSIYSLVGLTEIRETPSLDFRSHMGFRTFHAMTRKQITCLLGLRRKSVSGS